MVLDLLAQHSWRCLQLRSLYIENTCKPQVEASVWKDNLWMWRFFFSVQSACYLDNSRRFVASGAERVSMAVPNKQALSLTVSRVLLLLLPSLCSPYPLPPPSPPLTSLPSFNIRFLFSGVCCSAGIRPSQPSDRLTFLSLFSRQFFSLTPCFFFHPLSSSLLHLLFIASHCHLLCWCFISHLCVWSLGKLFQIELPVCCLCWLLMLEIWRISVPWSLPAEARLYQ